MKTLIKNAGKIVIIMTGEKFKNGCTLFDEKYSMSW